MTETVIKAAPVAAAVTVRDRVGRTRYVAFRLEGGRAPRPVMQAALPSWARLTRWDGENGIARCLHTQRDELIEALRGLTRVGRAECRAAPLVTSGTLRKAAEAFPEGTLEKAPRRREK